MVDFGIARPEDATAITRVGTMLGTPGFMAPEQVHGLVAGPAADVFALGAVLGFAATGRKPFGTGDTDSVLRRVVVAEADFAGIDDRVLRDLVAACLSVESAALPTATDLLDRLGHVGETAGWLPAPIEESIDRRAAAARVMLAGTEAPSPGCQLIASAFNSGGIRAVDPRTGALVWQRDADTVIDTTKDTAFLVNLKGWRVSAIDAATGETKWTHDPPPGETSAGVVLAREILCYGLNGTVRAIGAADGQPRWTTTVKAGAEFAGAGDVLVCVPLEQVIHSGFTTASGGAQSSHDVEQGAV